MTIDFTKLQSAGNDFILIEAAEMDMDWPELARTMCHRRFGIGGDGILLLLPSQQADFGMRIFNSDGSESEACGNGLRCLLHYVFTKGLTKKGTVTVSTAAGVRKARLFIEGKKLARIESGMGVPQLKAEAVPVAVEQGRGNIDLETGFVSAYPLAVQGQKLALNFVSMGNPHAVHFTDKPVADFPLADIGPLVENDKLFPRRINFEVARVVSDSLIEVAVWERGTGETLACGSGACAVAVAAQLLGFTGSEVNIKLPGGTLGVRWDGQGEVCLSGRAELVFSGSWPHN
jgi:diaminopimelate epimerase